MKNFNLNGKIYGIPTWIVEEGTSEQKLDYQKFFTKYYNMLTTQCDVNVSEDNAERLSRHWAVMLLTDK